MRKLLLMLCGLVAGCSALYSSPKVEMKDLAVVGIDAGGANLDLLLAVSNPNSYPLVLKGCTYNVTVMALPVATGMMREQIEFPGKTATDVHVPVRVGFRELRDVLKRAPDPAKIPYGLVGDLEVETPIGALTVPLNKQGELAVPERYRPDRYLKGISQIINRGRD